VNRQVEQEFLEFVQGATRGLFRVAFALTGQQQAAEDLTQAALEKVLTRWRRIDDPVAYARRVIYHEHVGRWRRWGRRELPVADPPEWTSAGDPAHAVVLRQALYRALHQLGPRQRAVLVLRYLEDRSEAEAAEILGCSRKTIASQASRALHRLRVLCADRLDLTLVEGGHDHV
jgi:RNA polymerase sigma-70 factor (sigma-E family)